MNAVVRWYGKLFALSIFTTISVNIFAMPNSEIEIIEAEKVRNAS